MGPISTISLSGVVMMIGVAGLSSQKEIVIPRGLEKKWGNAGLPLFLNSTRLKRGRGIQIVFDANMAVAGQLVAIAFRPVPGTSLGAPASNHTVSVGISQYSSGIESLVWNFSQNRGRHFKVLFKGQISFPAVPPRFALLSGFTFKIPLLTKYVMKGNQRYLVEVDVLASDLHLSNKTTGASIDSHGEAPTGDPRYARGLFGRTCPNHPFGNPIGVGIAMLGYPLAIGKGSYSGVFRKGAFGVLFLGSSKTRWGNMKLPFPLSPFGAKGCFVNVSPDYLIPAFGKIGGIGSVAAILRIPKTPSLIGTMVYLQGFTLGAYNPIGITSSQGAFARIGPFRAAAYGHVWAAESTWPRGGYPSPFSTPILKLFLK